MKVRKDEPEKKDAVPRMHASNQKVNQVKLTDAMLSSALPAGTCHVARKKVS